MHCLEQRALLERADAAASIWCLNSTAQVSRLPNSNPQLKMNTEARRDHDR